MRIAIHARIRPAGAGGFCCQALLEKQILHCQPDVLYLQEARFTRVTTCCKCVCDRTSLVHVGHLTSSSGVSRRNPLELPRIAFASICFTSMLRRAMQEFL